MCHDCIFSFISEESTKLTVNYILICTNELKRTSANPFRPFRCVTHDQDGFPETRSLFLDASRIGHNQITCCKKIMEIHNLERINNMEAIEAIQFLVSCFTHQRVHMYGIDCLCIWMFLHHTPYCTEHAMHRLTQILSAMRRYQNEA